jgi:hypothetical protein
MTKKQPLRARRRLAWLALGPLAFAGAGAATPLMAQNPGASEPSPTVAKSIVDLQPFREVVSGPVEAARGLRGTATLVNLNPEINTRYLLTVRWPDGSESSYDLQNPRPRSQRLALDANFLSGIELVENGERRPCDLFAPGSTSPLEQARKSPYPYVSLCDGGLFLRNPVKGHFTRLEAEAEFVRNNLWGGEKVTVIFHHLLEDTHRETAQIQAAGQESTQPATGAATEDAPLPALIDASYANRVLTPTGLGIPLAGVHGAVRPGAWYVASGNPGVYVSLIEPQLIETAILESHKATVNVLDSVEASSLCYLVAFDLDRFNLGYSLGTEHPSVEWSEHIQPQMKDARLPGPDGIGTIAPLVSTGMISPQSAPLTVAAFAGGFKRMHGAFKYGELATVDHGSHYGFVVDGVVFSRLQPGLATLYVLEDGSVEMKTWEAQDDHLLRRIRYARQNGVPLVEFDDRSQSTVPGPLVNEWGPGNWSGSEDMKLRTLRAGIALQTNGHKHFLIYAVFSDATPSAMARVFQAYRCRYGMPLDMNALEHSYLALYRRNGSQLLVDYLIEGMSEAEKNTSGGTVPRFLGYPDNRDFFFITRRSQ